MVFDRRYSYFDTRIVRRSNALFADLANQPYGKELCFQDRGRFEGRFASPPLGDKKSINSWRFQMVSNILYFYPVKLGEWNSI